MFDGRKLADGESIETDVCIVGAGASGIALALELINTPFNVALFESGGLKLKHKTQLLYRGESTGRPYFDIEFTKQRYFGGATNKWFGRCRPLDNIDFERRDWVPYSGWPFGKEELDPYYERAHTVCQLAPYNYDPSFWEDNEKKALPFDNTGIESKIFQFSPPTRFGKEYLTDIENAKNFKIFLFSNAVSISLNPDGKKVDHVKFVTLNGKTFKVNAKIFILAASALEITRLLLVSNDIQNSGIGNHNDMVGRFFMEHPHIFCGALSSPLSPKYSNFYNVLDYSRNEGNLGTVGALGFTEDMIRRQQLLNASAFFVRRKDYKVNKSYFSEGALALTNVVDIITHTRAPGFLFFKELKRVFRHLNIVSKILVNRMQGFIHTKDWITIRSQIETVPNPNSRVTLSTKKDRLGMNKLVLDWQLTQQDLDSFRTFQNILFNALQNIGCCMFPFEHELDDTGWPVTMMAGMHHMGTTRMHADSKKGVVDPNCRVQGVYNLYIAGSSVFPTSGHANPMLTIIALAIRLADHVKELMKEKE